MSKAKKLSSKLFKQLAFQKHLNTLSNGYQKTLNLWEICLKKIEQD